MQTKHEPKSKPNANQNQPAGQAKRGKHDGVWTPPRGIRYSFRADRPNAPFYLHWREGGADGKRAAEKALGFADEPSREARARALAAKRESHGVSVLSFDPRRWAKYEEFQAIVGADTDPILVAHQWLEYRQGVGKSGAKGLTVSDAFKRYVELRKAEEKLADDTWRHINKHVGQRFCAEHGAKRLSELTADDIREWLAELVDPKTDEPMAPQTKKHHRQDVNTFLDRARLEGWIMRNPCEIVAVPEVEDGDVVVISPEDAFKFFKANIDEPVVARIALEAFGALRYSTAGRIHKEHLNFEEKGIEMPGRMHKSGKRKWRQGQPALLWGWLKRATDVTWGMSLLNYREWKRAALIRAGLRPLGVASDEDRDTLHGLRNIWRHSFASYMLASTKNMPLVAYLMQHTKTTTTEIYEGVATEADARLYLALTPGNVAKARDWADFKRRVGPAKRKP